MTVHPYLADLLGDLFGVPERDLRPGVDLEAGFPLDSLAVVALEGVAGVRMGVGGGVDLRALGDLWAVVGNVLSGGEAAVPALNLREEGETR